MAAKRFKATSLSTYSSQNLIRIVITSYFIATSLEIIYGTNAGVLIQGIVDPELARAIGGGATFSFSFLLLCGFAMRLMALLLGLLIFWASFINAFMLDVEHGVDNFWRDLALIAALMLTYLPHSPRDMKHAAVLRRHTKVRKMGPDGKEVVPRRVRNAAARNPALPPVSSEEELSLRLRRTKAKANVAAAYRLDGPAIADMSSNDAANALADDFGPAVAARPENPDPISALRAAPTDTDDEEDILNIFAPEPSFAHAS